MSDIEFNKPIEEPERSERSSLWRVLLFISCVSFGFSLIFAPTSYIVELTSAWRGGSDSSNKYVGWHIKPIHPHHHGKVEYFTEETNDGTVYKRVFTAPCAAGMLVFNVGPAASYEPFAYDVYEDAYAYSDNNGLCILYPSYTGTQTSNVILWDPEKDPTERQIDLGDLPNKISSRVVIPVGAKNNTKRGGDFLIIRDGNFYNPTYYKHLKALVNSWHVAVDDIETQLEEQFGVISL
jgi:hypothetical protein